MSASPVVMETNLAGPEIELVSRGKVRDIYRLNRNGVPVLLLVATDRISAFDVVLPNGIPDKGKVLTGISLFWFHRFARTVPNHVLTADVDQMPEVLRPHRELLRGRAMLVQECRPFPVECVVRGYLAGSGLKEYRAMGAVCGVKLPEGLVEASRLPEPIFTPSTKAPAGQHDENINFQRMAELVGLTAAQELQETSLLLFSLASKYAKDRGVLLADTKFEFGLRAGRLVWIDEALTPDSSRYWEKAMWVPGKTPVSYDKQPVRDWLETTGWDKQPPAPEMTPEAIEATRQRYLEIYKRLTGESLAA